VKLEPVPLDPAPTDGALRRNLDAALAQVAALKGRMAANMGSRSCLLVAKTPSNSISAVGDLNDHGRVAMADAPASGRNSARDNGTPDANMITPVPHPVSEHVVPQPSAIPKARQTVLSGPVPQEGDSISIMWTHPVWQLPASDPEYRPKLSTDSSDDEDVVVERWYPGVIMGKPSPRKLKSRVKGAKV